MAANLREQTTIDNNTPPLSAQRTPGPEVATYAHTNTHTHTHPGVAMAAELRDQPTRPPASSEGGCSEAGRPAVAPPLVPKAARFALRPHEAVAAATRRQVWE